MAIPQVLSVSPGSPADSAGVLAGDGLVAINGEMPRDVIQYQLLIDGPTVDLDLDRGGVVRSMNIEKADGEPLGIEVQSALFDQVRTCDNHCSFCFIYQLPPGMRKSLYLKDDDYRLSFLYGNFTTLTRFTEADLERIITERLSPLYVSIHATNGVDRSALLRNRRGATSLRWLRALLDEGIEVHGQIVVCPGVNDGDVLAETMLGICDEFSELESVAVVPLGVSDHSDEADMRPHTQAEASDVVDLVEGWQDVFNSLFGRPLVYLADEYYLLAERPFPAAEVYGDFDMHEDGVGMARNFELEFSGTKADAVGTANGFFAWVDGAPAAGYRAPRHDDTSKVDGRMAGVVGPVAGCGTTGNAETDNGATDNGVTGNGAGVSTQSVSLRPSRSAPIGIVTGTYGRQVLEPLLKKTEAFESGRLRLVEVPNRFFGGNIGVTGLLVGQDIAAALDREPEGHRYLLPDVCLSGDRFLDGTSTDELPRPVEIVATDGHALREACGL